MAEEKELAKSLLKHVAGQTILEADKLDNLDLLWSELKMTIAGHEVILEGDLREGSFKEEIRISKLRKLAEEGKTKRKPSGSEQRASGTDESEDDLNESEQKGTGSVSESSESGSGDGTEESPLMTDSARETIKDALD